MRLIHLDRLYVGGNQRLRSEMLLYDRNYVRKANESRVRKEIAVGVVGNVCPTYAEVHIVKAELQIVYIWRKAVRLLLFAPIKVTQAHP